MTQTLPEAGRAHHDRLLQTVDRMPAIGDALLIDPPEAVRRSVDELDGFLTGTLVPHIDAAERTLYPELERLFQNRHSMAPMRREHEEARALVRQFTQLTSEVDLGRTTIGRTLAIRRVLFQLYALLKVHLAEEAAYLRIVDHGVTSDVGEMLAAAMDHPVVGPA